MKETYRELALSKPSPSPWATWEQQITALQATLTQVIAMKSLAYRPVVEIDLDLTSLLAVHKATRTLQELVDQIPSLSEHLREVPEETRQALALGLKEIWSNPASAQYCLPGYTDGAIEGYGIYVAALMPNRLGIKIDQEVEEKLAEWIRSTVYAKLRSGYWERDLIEDEISPGLVDFLVALHRQGGEAVFVSNRPPSTQSASIARLSNAIAAANDMLPSNTTKIPLFGYFGPGGSAFDGPSKAAAQQHLEQNPSPQIYYAQVSADGVVSYGAAEGQGPQVIVTAVFDDRSENRRLIMAGAKKSTELLRDNGREGIISVAMATLWHTAEIAVTDSPHVVASFEASCHRLL